MGKTTYQKAWGEKWPWLSSVKNDPDCGYCKLCYKTFKIDGSGASQVKKHESSILHTSRNKTNQRTFINDRGTVSISKNKKITYSEEDEVVKAEILKVLKVVSCRYSFRSVNKDSLIYKEMFPDSKITASFSQEETKVKYNIQYGIAPYITESFIKDLCNCPFTFKFDETTTKQVKKQCDGYVQYFSKHCQIITAYCGSLFIGHCDSSDLVQHFIDFSKKLKWDNSYLLQLGMDGPSVKKAFEKKLSEKLHNEMNKSFINVDTCPLHIVHNSFRNTNNFCL